MFVYNKLLTFHKGVPMETSYWNNVGHSWNLIWQALVFGALVGPLEGILIHVLMKFFGILDTPTIYG